VKLLTMVLEKKMKIASAAKILKLNKSTAKMIVKKYRETGKVGRNNV
jgi:transposase